MTLRPSSDPMATGFIAMSWAAMVVQLMSRVCRHHGAKVSGLPPADRRRRSAYRGAPNRCDIPDDFCGPTTSADSPLSLKTHVMSDASTACDIVR
jgi:hypothetical protein